jgi:hypothetical protein
MTTRRTTILSLIAVAALVTACVASNSTASPAPAPSASPSTQASAEASAPSASPSTEAPSAAPPPQGSEPVELDPADFVATIDNPFWPMAVGNKWVYRETDAEGTEQKVEVTVTGDTKEIIGITATVVHDVVSEDGDIVEDTLDWYAQDAAGNLWYLGEDTKEYENGKVASTEGSWTAGVDGAQPGIILPAQPEVGMIYRQEYYRGQAEDAAEILSLDEHVEVPAGTYDDVLQTKDYTPLDPDVVEHKFYASGVGPVQVIAVSGESSREELLTFSAGGS